MQKKFIVFMLFIASFESFASSLPRCSKEEEFARMSGDAFDTLPASVKQSGKRVTLSMSDCKENIVVKFTTYPLRDDIEDCINYSQVVYLSQEKPTATVVFLSPDKKSLKEGRGSIILEVMNESVWPMYLFSNVLDWDILKVNGSQTKRLYKNLKNQLSHECVDDIKFEYKDIKNGQTIHLERPCKNRTSKHWLKQAIEKIEQEI